MFRIKSLVGLISVIGSVISFFTNENNAPENENFVLSVNAFGNEKESFDTIKWYATEEEYTLFLPSDVDRNSLTVYFDGAETIQINETTLHSGDNTNVFASSDTYTISVGTNSYNLRIFESENIPSMFLETKKPLEYIHENKSNKTTAKIRTFENGEMTLDSELKHIKGRGNSTWKYAKKPYNIKFDKKTKLLGMDKAKKWSLLANYFDPAGNKNPIGWEVAKYFDQKFIPDYRFVDLYINHEYLGNYLICEPVEIGENRLDIFDLTKATEDANDGADLESFNIEHSEPFGALSRAQWVNIPNNPEDITGGYLLECDFAGRTESEVSSFTTSRQQNVVIKEPEYASKKQVEYISSLFQEAEDAIASPTGYNALGKHFSDYFDMNSLVNYYILLELSENIDSGLTSTFFYKDQGEKICAGPLWDNDSAFGNIGLQQGITTTDPSKWIANQNHYDYEDDLVDEYPTIFTRLFRQSYFREKVNQRWSQLRKTLTKTVTDEIIDSVSEPNNTSAIMNAYRWYGTTDQKVFDFIIELSKQFFTKRFKYFDIGFSKRGAFLFYDVNGGRGSCTENRILMNGQVAIVNGPYSVKLADLEHMQLNNVLDIFDLYDYVVHPIKAPSDDMVFVGWNTRRDGRGKWYLPGDPIFMYGTTTLYAQWKVATGNEPDYTKVNPWDDPVLEFLESVFNVFGMMLFN